MSHEIHKQAREMLELQCKAYSDEVARLQSLIAALREKLDHIPDAGKMIGPEPVLFIHPSTLEMASAHVGAWKPGHELPGYIALYTSPPQRQPLTYDQVFDAVYPLYADARNCHAAIKVSMDEYRAIEAAHEIKEKIE